MQASVAIAAVSLVLCMERPVLAVLGEPQDSIARDQQMLQATLATQPQAGYTVHVLTTPGAIVKEYVSPSGVVFALAWRHRSGLLDLQTLFGSYYQEYAKAMIAQSPHSRRSHRMTTEHLVVERGGRMGADSGHVWVIPLVPPGLSQTPRE